MAATVASADKGARQPLFGFYLLKGGVDVDKLNELDVDKIDLQKEPIFTSEDIISCSQSEESIRLRKPAFDKFMSIAVGTPFAVCVKGKPLYVGAVWRQISAQSCSAIVAAACYPLGRQSITISAGYPTRENFSGKNPAAATEIFQLACEQ